MKILGLVLSLLLPTTLLASPGLWHDPENDGHGVYISRDTGAGHAVIWYLYDDYGRPSWLISGENCQEFPCQVPLHSPSANWMGGDLDLNAPVGSLTLGPAGEKLAVEYEVIRWVPELCGNVSPGGLIFLGCVGKFELTLLAE